MYFGIYIVSIIGFLLSIYAFSVEKKSEKSKSYKPLCDISKKISCTKAFASKYGRLAGVSNSFAGIFFYIIVFLLAFLGQLNYVFYLAIISVLGSLYLAYAQIMKVKSFCLVCSCIYLVNLLLLFFSYAKLF
ncbi:hypothetical protein KY313_01930 [Candidatus Woesearchaeota archaeon]|jgi:vitamin-K-epoxide reductase (warfarin-sensitive)|nr:hypothetical protein [Candidatus Woesearchaeota archaeon]